MQSIHKLHSNKYMSTVLKRHSRGIFTECQGDCSYQVHSDQMVLQTVMQEAGPQKRQPNGLKSMLTQGGPSGSSPLRSDGSCDYQTGGWTS
jgi:hypothetical protein